MANGFKKPTKTWVIDTAGSSVVDANVLRIRRLTWAGTGIVNADQVVVQDQNGNEFWQRISSGGNIGAETVFAPPYPQVDGLKVPTLGHGILEIELA